MLIRLLVEGRLDEAVAQRLAVESGFIVENAQGKQGWMFVQRNLPTLNAMAQFTPCLALVDFMDTRTTCPPSVVSQWIPNRNDNMVFRIVVRELESWLLADRQGIARFLRVPVARVPAAPEEEDDPKRTLVNLARSSSSRRIREALVPAQGASAVVGRNYNAEMERFIRSEWSPTPPEPSPPASTNA